MVDDRLERFDSVITASDQDTTQLRGFRNSNSNSQLSKFNVVDTTLGQDDLIHKELASKMDALNQIHAMKNISRSNLNTSSIDMDEKNL